MIVPNLQKERINEYMKEGKRFDGRKPEDYRDLNVEMNLSKNAESSCSVKLGETEVFVGVKLGLTEPYPDSPDEGGFMTSAELSPLASEEFELGPPRINAIELGRVIDRGIRESGLLDMKKLCIKEGEKAWQVFVDIVAINDDGNLLDAAALGAIIALGNARLPVYNEEEGTIEHELSEEKLPLNYDALAFNMTFHKIGDKIVCDVTREEEETSDFRISIAVADDGNGEARITAMQKGKEGVINDEDMDKILELAESKFKEMFPKVKELVLGK